MERAPGLPSFRWAFAAGLLLLPCAPAAGASGLMVQQIGDLSGDVVEAVVAEVMVVPLSPDLDPRSTPIILAPGTAFVGRDGEGVGGLHVDVLDADDLDEKDPTEDGEPHLQGAESFG
jgi:hypothetical protein